MKVLTVSIFLFSVSFAQIDYTSQIQPIFNQYCVSCHGRNGGLNLTSYAELMKGGNSGASVIAGDVSSSILIQRIDGTINPRMPKDSDALSDSIVSLIKKWINEGAMENVSINGEDPFPSNFKILGNYPNPFNPVTRIVINSDIRVEGRAVITTVSGRTIYDFGAIQLIPGRNSVLYIYFSAFGPYTFSQYDPFKIEGHFRAILYK